MKNYAIAAGVLAVLLFSILLLTFSTSGPARMRVSGQSSAARGSTYSAPENPLGQTKASVIIPTPEATQQSVQIRR